MLQRPRTASLPTTSSWPARGNLSSKTATNAWPAVACSLHCIHSRPTSSVDPRRASAAKSITTNSKPCGRRNTNADPATAQQTVATTAAAKCSSSPVYVWEAQLPSVICSWTNNKTRIKQINDVTQRTLQRGPTFASRVTFMQVRVTSIPPPPQPSSRICHNIFKEFSPILTFQPDAVLSVGHTLHHEVGGSHRGPLKNVCSLTLGLCRCWKVG